MKIHVILNSHLDPIWLWRRSQGTDEVLNTARTACRMLEMFPQINITRGEAWFYEVVEKCDPQLFKRIRKHIDSGRWEVVGGWYVQPDCNFPTPEVFRKHNELAGKYFREHLGVTVKTAYNVDTFGHTATLPDFYNEAGIQQYVMMRPRDYEKTLPARNFIWESPNGGKLQVFRIWNDYAFNASMERMIWQVPRHYDKNLGITMALIGFGDHGGGPLVNEIKWILDHQKYSDDIELVFSRTDQYFDAVREAVRAQKTSLPVVKDELQYHAIGCYAAVNRVKSELKATSSWLTQADKLEARSPKLFEKGDAQLRENCWKGALFATFHDVLSGSSIRSAYDDIYDDLAAGRSAAKHQIEYAIRKMNTALPDCPVQRLIFDNLSDKPFKGLYECEPAIGHERWKKPYHVALTTLDGKTEIPLQRIVSETPMKALRIAFPLELEPFGRAILALPFRESTAKPCSVTLLAKNFIVNATSAIHLNPAGLFSYTVKRIEFLKEALCFQVVKDTTDTWSHETDRLDEEVLSTFKMDENGWHTDLEGSLLTRLSATFVAPEGTVRCEVILRDGEPEAELKLRIHWFANAKLLRLSIKPAFDIAKRQDGIPNGILQRGLSEQEFPFTDFSALSAQNGQTLVIASKDVNSFCVRPDSTVRITLLRSPYYAWDMAHKVDPQQGFPSTDQGEFEMRIKLLGLKKFNRKAIDETVARLETERIHFSETTKGFVNPYQLKSQEDPDFKKHVREWAKMVGEKI